MNIKDRIKELANYKTINGKEQYTVFTLSLSYFDYLPEGEKFVRKWSGYRTDIGCTDDYSTIDEVFIALKERARYAKTVLSKDIKQASRIEKGVEV